MFPFYATVVVNGPVAAFERCGKLSIAPAHRPKAASDALLRGRPESSTGRGSCAISFPRRSTLLFARIAGELAQLGAVPDQLELVQALEAPPTAPMTLDKLNRRNRL